MLFCISRKKFKIQNKEICLYSEKESFDLSWMKEKVIEVIKKNKSIKEYI